MSSLISLIVEFLASVGATIKARQQSRATEELPRGEAEIKAIGEDVAAIRAEMAKLTEPSAPTKPEQPVKLPPN